MFLNQQNNNQAVKITVDNSKLRKEVTHELEQGSLKFNKGTTLEEKEEGLKIQLQALKKLKLWIDRETDIQTKEQITQIYTSKMKDMESKLQILEQQQQIVKAPPQIIQPMQQGGGGGGGQNNKDEEKDKFKSMISDAIVQEKPNVKWEDIAGLINAKESLKEAVIMPIKFPQIFEGIRKPWKGILLYGPPGTGKTFLAKACATEADATFFSISAADLVSKYVGETEKMIKALFNLAREKKPAIIFIDECDSMFGARGEGQQDSSRRAITEFLTQMQGVGRDDEGVLVLGATNLPWALDAAVRRRFEKRIYIPLPDQEARLYMFEHNLRKNQHQIQHNDFQEIANSTDGYSGSDISIVVKDAVMQPVRLLQTTNKFKKIINKEGKEKLIPVIPSYQGNDCITGNYMSLDSTKLEMPEITKIDIIESVKKCKPSVSHDQLKEYENFTKTFGQDG